MSVIEDIKNYSEKMNVTFFSKNWVKVCNLEKEISRHLQKYMRDRSYKLTFTSQDLRSLTVKLEKVHKGLNTTSTFMALKKKFNKYDIIPPVALSDILKENAIKLALARKAQESLGFLNRYCAVLNVLEEGVALFEAQERKRVEEEKIKDAEAFNKVLIEALNEARGN